MILVPPHKQDRPTSAVGPMLACPSVAGEYTAFLREKRCITRSPVRNPMTRVTMKVMTTLIATVETVRGDNMTACIFGIAKNY